MVKKRVSPDPRCTFRSDVYKILQERLSLTTPKFAGFFWATSVKNLPFASPVEPLRRPSDDIISWPVAGGEGGPAGTWESRWGHLWKSMPWFHVSWVRILTTRVLYISVYCVYSKILRHLAAQFFQEKSLSRCWRALSPWNIRSDRTRDVGYSI